MNVIKCSPLLQNDFGENFEWPNFNRRLAYYIPMRRIESRNSLGHSLIKQLGQEEDSSCYVDTIQTPMDSLAAFARFNPEINVESFSVRSTVMWR
ncbi:hypothetical protein QN277_005385 [Acacia crassicarpa]|uniref:Uncharacterized protein n=1 Tax=Acacia crassicarpa TaxID=499986 RepID=A0AAE1IWC6_9FABA|nr:hypothetical protein QN277_005385 [Acacia crassicarpa]